jgi:hypothetical protein
MRHLIVAKLGGMRGKVYIDLMRAASLFPVWLPMLAAAVIAWPHAAGAQAFSADYDLSRAAAAPVAANILSGAGTGEALRIGGGYRWSDGQSLSLHVTSGRGRERLGLSVSYDWPRYFVRLSYDPGLNPVMQDKLRFSAGVRF